jgi:hypothetical protein
MEKGQRRETFSAKSPKWWLSICGFILSWDGGTASLEV